MSMGNDYFFVVVICSSSDEKWDRELLQAANLSNFSFEYTAHTNRQRCMHILIFTFWLQLSDNWQVRKSSPRHSKQRREGQEKEEKPAILRRNSHTFAQRPARQFVSFVPWLDSLCIKTHFVCLSYFIDISYDWVELRNVFFCFPFHFLYSFVHSGFNTSTKWRHLCMAHSFQCTRQGTC